MWVRKTDAYGTPNISGKDVPIIVKWLHETDVENRLEGDHIFASFVIDS